MQISEKNALAGEIIAEFLIQTENDQTFVSFIVRAIIAEFIQGFREKVIQFADDKGEDGITGHHAVNYMIEQLHQNIKDLQNMMHFFHEKEKEENKKC